MCNLENDMILGLKGCTQEGLQLKPPWDCCSLAVRLEQASQGIVTVAGCHTQCILLLVLLATCRGSSLPLHSAADVEPTTEQCTPRQAELQALLFREFDENAGFKFSGCPMSLWLDVYHRASPSLDWP